MIFIQWLGHRWFAWCVILVNAALAGLGVAIGYSLLVGGDPWWVVAVLAGACFAGLFAGAWVRFAAPRRALSTVSSPDRGQTSVAIWRPALIFAASLLVPFTLAASAGLVTAWIVGTPWWPWLVVLGLLMMLVPQVMRSLLRRPVLVMGQEGLTYRGPSVDAFVGWADVAAIEVRRNLRGPVLVVRASTAGGSWRWRRRYWITPVEIRPSEPGFEIEAQGPRDVELVEVLPHVLQDYRRSPATRAELGTPAVADRVAAVRRRTA